MEINRSDELERSLRELEQKYRMSSKEEREANEKALRKNEQKMDKMETHLNSIIARLKDEAKQSEAVFKEILDQQEEEYEMELMKLVSETETKLYGEHCVTQKVRGVVQTIQSRQEQLSKKNKELKSKTDCFEQDYLKEKMKREEMEVKCFVFVIFIYLCSIFKGFFSKDIHIRVVLSILLQRNLVQNKKIC